MSDAGDDDAGPRTGGRSVAEWLTFAVSCAVLGVVAVLIAVQMAGTDAPAAPAVGRPGPTREDAGQFFVPVDVSNDGDLTATQVQVMAELTIGDTMLSGDQVIDFLGGGETERLVFSFDEDPARGELVIRVTGYTEP